MPAHEPLRVVALSDTHTRPVTLRLLMQRLAPHLEGADHILHAGDIVCGELLRELRAYAPVTAVAGNMDGPEIRGDLGDERVVELGDFRFGLVHGWGAGHDLPRRVWERFVDAGGRPTVDAVVFGHSHRALVERRDGLLLINPGSAAEKRGAPNCSLAELRLGDEIDVRIVPIPG